MRCDDCKYAEWLMTPKGRLHPSGQGRCVYYKKIPLPQSMPYTYNLPPNGKFFEVKGGYIQRKEELKHPCAYYGDKK